MCSLLDGNKSPRSYSGRPEGQQPVSWLCTREAGLALYLLVDGKGGVGRFDPQGRGGIPSIFKNKTFFGAEGGVKGHRPTVRQSVQLRDLAHGEHSHVASTQTKTQHRAEDTGTGW